MKLESLAVHAATAPHTDEPGETPYGAVAAPIVLSTTYLRAEDGGYPSGYMYSRIANPNRHMLEQALAALETEQSPSEACAFAFSSGMAAVNALMMTLKPGDHILIGDDLYHGSRHLFAQVFGPWQLETEQVDMANPEQVKAQIKSNTALIWLETPSNPSLKLADIAQLAEVAHEAGLLLVLDNTWGSPIFQKGFDLGADVIMYSTTKYHGGHSDVLGGALIVHPRHCASLGQRLYAMQNLAGAVPSPFDCWLLLRSLPTMPLRVRQQAANAMEVAQFLEQHPAVTKVHYPGLASHPQHALAVKQMQGGFGGMLSFEMADEKKAHTVANSLQMIKQATSLGGVESLIEHRASIEGPDTPTPKSLLRFSCGIENVSDIISDLKQILDRLI